MYKNYRWHKIIKVIYYSLSLLMLTSACSVRLIKVAPHPKHGRAAIGHIVLPKQYVFKCLNRTSCSQSCTTGMLLLAEVGLEGILTAPHTALRLTTSMS